MYPPKPPLPTGLLIGTLGTIHSQLFELILGFNHCRSEKELQKMFCGEQETTPTIR
jgi:hypothetical protein